MVDDFSYGISPGEPARNYGDGPPAFRQRDNGKEKKRQKKLPGPMLPVEAIDEQRIRAPFESVS
jgi:hypothetical protein